MGFNKQNITLRVHYDAGARLFGRISLPSLHDQDIKFPDGTFVLGT